MYAGTKWERDREKSYLMRKLQDFEHIREKMKEKERAKSSRFVYFCQLLRQTKGLFVNWLISDLIELFEIKIEFKGSSGIVFISCIFF